MSKYIKVEDANEEGKKDAKGQNLSGNEEKNCWVA